MLVLFLFLSLGVLVIYCGMYKIASDGLRHSLDQIKAEAGAKS